VPSDPQPQAVVHFSTTSETLARPMETPFDLRRCNSVIDAMLQQSGYGYHASTQRRLLCQITIA
jgi:hypothetical protein